jgi:N-acetylglucosamine-6-phosphate deacetylase
MTGPEVVGPRSGRLGVRRAIVEGELVDGDVEVRDGVVTAVGLRPAGSGMAVPGLVDLQVNGYAGVDVGDADVDGINHIGRALASDGVLAWCPTVVTSPDEDIVRGVGTVGLAMGSTPTDAARLLGTHLEGPFLSRDRAGVHPRDLLRPPDRALIDRVLDAGPLAILTLAPELPGAIELIGDLAGSGVVLSAGHTDASTEVARRAFDAGVRMTTHTWNGMRPLLHRDPGVLGAALTDPRVSIGLIGDGVHVDREVLDLTWRAAGDRICLVTDAVAAARAPDGRYRIGDIVIEREGDRVLDLEGRVGGGVTPLLEAVRIAIDLGVPLTTAFASATSRPAALVGRPELGVLRVGGPADLLVLDEDLRLEHR